MSTTRKKESKSRILIYLPANAVQHAEILPPKRRAYLEGFIGCRNVLVDASIPVCSSFHGVDYAMTAAKPAAKRGSCHFLNAPYAHPLVSILERSFEGHMQWQYRNGVKLSAYGLFNPEFDIFRGNKLAPKGEGEDPQIMFGLAMNGETFLYSECGTNGVKSEGKLGTTHPVYFHDKIIVPLHGVMQAQAQFFLWQRLPTKENGEALMAELWKLVNNGKDDVMTFFMDFEAPLVGSHRGMEIWGMFFSLIVEAGLAPHIVDLPAAVTHWRETAVKMEGAARYFVRHVGAKWTGLHTQMDWLMKIATGPRPEDGDMAAQVAWSFVTSSDVLAVMNRQVRGDAVLPSEQGTVTIAANLDVLIVAQVIFHALETFTRPEDALRKRTFSNPDSRWYADQVADLIASYR